MHLEAGMGARTVGERPITAKVRERSQLTLPAEVREALHVEAGDEVEFEMVAPGVVQLVGMKRVRSDQAWFWSEDWQAGEGEASEQLARGEGTVHEDGDSFLKALGDGE